MSNNFESGRIVAHGPTTRATRLTTGQLVRFAPEALQDIIRQVRENFVIMNVEHLNLLPPIGRWSDGHVKTLDDGEQQVVLYGSMLPQYDARSDFRDPFRPAIETAENDSPTVQASIRAEARNFEPEVWQDSIAEATLPVTTTNKWAALPPIEWLIAIPVTWGAVRFAGSFLDRLGSEAAAGLVDWIKRTSRKAKEPERHRYVTIAFELEDGRNVYGFIPFGPDDEELPHLRRALDGAGELAEVAGAQRDGVTQAAHQIAYLHDGESWRLAWFATGDGVYRTKFFLDNQPEPERFLGYPLLPDGSSEA